MATSKNAKTTTTENAATKVITGLVRFSYVHVFEPSAINDSTEKKYSVALLIPKKDKKQKLILDKAVEAAKIAGKADKFGGKIPAALKLPIRDGDAERDEHPEYAGHWFINATSKTKPGIVDENTQAIIDPEEFYSGCYGRASVNFYAFNNSGNKGIACGLNNVQKLRDGERLSGRASAEDDFGDVETPDLSQFEDEDANEDIDEFM